MDGLPVRRIFPRAARAGLGWLAAGLLVAVGGGRAEASSLLQRIALEQRIALAESQPGGPFAAYYEAALANHSLHVQVPPIFRLLRPVNGLLPDWAFVDYLRWRWSLNPARFDFFHPTLGPWIQADLLLRQVPPATTPVPTVSPEVVTATRPPATPHPCPLILPCPSHPKQIDSQVVHHTPPPTPPPHHQVPEPSTGLMALAMVASVAWWRHRKGRPA
jgi:hypothetical protein